jgi:hypothetical protein
MVNSICNLAFASLRGRLGDLTLSENTLLMADGACVSSHGRWFGDVSLDGRTVRAGFEIFPSGGGWSLLFGKPLLQQFRAVHDYSNDTLMIPLNGSWSTLVNEANKPPGRKLNISIESENILRGDDKPPLRQVLHPDMTTSESVDKQELLDIPYICYRTRQNTGKTTIFYTNCCRVGNCVATIRKRKLENMAECLRILRKQRGAYVRTYKGE